ncbi:peptide chain release factor N(5)-glutamine methyltransferase [Cyanobium sp. Morenito 9A2]|uniref:peptide chain release factor N(5)-glutamine methyltransferase n=1 Tax=Cyanobium sp. Morenito 9A2 TaxID=2823718 RepID=UPI0020CC464A|nr:peptide chain release factor N(5)-glutamine methyltransferase [Cyanobium sp. Morenito 9A2]MCP9851156.1 peptide chain release factor N(5)-glutamine methyltransferase [Cyanobium sp. Morenito 9A2]
MLEREAPTAVVGTELLAWRRRLLAGGGGAAELDWLLDLAGGLPWVALQRLWLEPKREVTLVRSLQELEAIWHRHCQSATPLQYLVGICPWRDLELQVAPGVLIPRQETELLVDLALGRLPALSPGPVCWADLGTGSGALAVALAAALPQGSQGYAVDCSPEALAQAGTNLERAGVASSVALRLGSWWEPLKPLSGQLDLVVSNPPYIPTALLAQLEPVVREHEPHLALDGGADGLESLRTVVAGAAQALAPGGWLLLEHHHDQGPAVADLLVVAGLEEASTELDLEGHGRFSCARRPAPGGPTPGGSSWVVP